MKVTYWTTACLEPEIEAVSKEVFELSAHFTGSRIFGISPHLFVRFSKRHRCVGFHPNFDPLLRIAIPLVEMASDLNHVYGEISPWLFSRALGKKPTVLTIASEKGEPDADFMHRCSVIAVQTENMRRRLHTYNLDDRKIRLIYPGIDLSHFTRRQDAAGFRRPKILLATFPRSAEELEARGVLFLLEMAKTNPGVDFHFVSRPWKSGSSGLAATQRLLETLGTANVQISEGVQDSMEDLYKRHDFTIVPYTQPEGGKECPRSLVETLACGVPVLISDVAPFSAFVAEHDCGRVFSLSAQGFGAALEAGLNSYSRISHNAVDCAQAYFDRENTFRAYAGVYRHLMSIRRKRAR